MAHERITVDPNRMRGVPCIRDTRVTVSAVLGQLAAGASIDELVAVSELSDLEARAHRIAESPEGKLIDAGASIRHLLGR